MLTPSRRPRPLMPQDREIIRILGIKPSEYRWFLEESAKASRARPIEGPVAFEITLATAFFINLAIGLATTALSLLLAPKPQQPRNARITTRQVDGQDIVKTDRFTAKSGFDSIQNVVELGSIIPLVYAKREVLGGVAYGGVRVNATLLWSQMLSLGGNQFFRGIYMLGQGGIQEIDPLQFALGDNLLNGYGIETAGSQAARATFYLRLNGGRIQSGDYISGRQASEDPGNFLNSDIYRIPNQTGALVADASGAAKPSNQTQFGLYSPIPSCMTYRVNPSVRPMWQPQTVLRNNGKHFVIVCNRDLQVQTDRWRDQSAFAGRIFFPSLADGITSVSVGNTVVMRLGRQTDADHEYKIEEDTASNETTSDDGRNAAAVTSCLAAGQSVAGRQEAADDAIAVGELYLIGTALAVCLSRDSNPFVSNADFPSFDDGSSVQAIFRIIEPGVIGNYAPVSQNDPVAPIRGPLLTATNRPQSYRMAIATVALGRRARVIEIGIRSTLGIQINGLMNFRDSWSLRRADRRACLKYQYDPNASKPSGAPGGGPDGWPVYRTAKGEAASTVEITINETFTATGTADVNGDVSTTGSISVSDTAEVQEQADNQDDVDFFRNVQFQNGTIQAPAERYSFWQIRYRKAGGSSNWSTLSNLYGTRGRTQQPIYNYIRIAWPSYDDWEFSFKPVSGYQVRNSSANMYVIDYKEPEINVNDGPVSLWFRGEAIARTRRSFRISYFESKNDIGEQESPDGISGNVYPAVLTDTISGAQRWNYVDGWDKLAEIFMYDEITTTAQNGPEHEISYVNIFEENTTVPNYDDIAIVGMNIAGSVGVNQLSQLSAYVTVGLQNTHLWPEIYEDMLTNPAYSSQGVLAPEQVNSASFAAAAAFNLERRYFCDIALSEPVNRRQWGLELAPYFLLDLVTRNGQLYLEPAFNFTSAEPITGQFTAGNIVEDSLEITAIDNDARQPVIVSVKWRQERQASSINDRGLFPVVREVTVRRVGTPANARIVRIDMSEYCTSQAHAVDAAKYQCLLPVLQGRACKFRTWPQAGSIVPGRCFILGTEFVSYETPAGGVIGFDGVVTSWPPLADGSYNAFVWQSGGTTTNEQTLTITNGLSSPPGAIFSLQAATSDSLVFKATNVSLNEEAEVEVEGVEFPLDENGVSLFADGFDDPSNWVIDGLI